MIDRLILYCVRPRKVLLILPTYRHVKHWLTSNHGDIVRAGGTIKHIDSTVTFSNGAVIYLGHGTTPEDLDRYRGLAYDVVEGGDDQLKQREGLYLD